MSPESTVLWCQDRFFEIKQISREEWAAWCILVILVCSGWTQGDHKLDVWLGYIVGPIVKQKQPEKTVQQKQPEKIQIFYLQFSKEESIQDSRLSDTRHLPTHLATTKKAQALHEKYMAGRKAPIMVHMIWVIDISKKWSPPKRLMNSERFLAQLLLHEPIKYLASAKVGGRCSGYVCYTSAAQGVLRPHHSLDKMQGRYGQWSWRGQEGCGMMIDKDFPCVICSLHQVLG